jgi:hypothetical protein
VAELVIERDPLVVRLSWWERLVAVHGDVRVPLATIRPASVVADRAEPRKRFRTPAVHVRLEAPSKFAELLVSVADPEAVAVSIRQAAGGPET